GRDGLSVKGWRAPKPAAAPQAFAFRGRPLYHFPRQQKSPGPEALMATVPQPRPGVLEIDPYVPGESKLPSGLVPIKLSSNETPLGPSPKALAAYREAASALERYPDGA